MKFRVSFFCCIIIFLVTGPSIRLPAQEVKSCLRYCAEEQAREEQRAWDRYIWCKRYCYDLFPWEQDAGYYGDICAQGCEFSYDWDYDAISRRYDYCVDACFYE